MIDTPPGATMDDAQLLRYSRHILLDDIGIEGQSRWLAAHVLVVGLGGLGSAAALYLAGAGVGHLSLADADVVDASNLQRQVIHRTATVGQSKVDSARQTIAALNPDVHVQALPQRADEHSLPAWVAAADVVLDCSDNFQTRHHINAACVAHGKPLVSAAAVGFDGQLAVYDTRSPHGPCYACLFDPHSGATDAACATTGIFAPACGVMGVLQAAQALAVLLEPHATPSSPEARPLAGGQRAQPSSTAPGALHVARGELLLFDARTLEWTRMRAQRRDDCPVCGAGVGATAPTLAPPSLCHAVSGSTPERPSLR